MNIGQIVKMHEDDRRIIFECNSTENNFSVQLFHIKTKIPLGNHYHREKCEIFVIAAGKGKIITQTVNREGKPLEEASKQEITAGSVITVPEYTAHCFILEAGSKMICFSTSAFNPRDLIPHKLT